MILKVSCNLKVLSSNYIKNLKIIVYTFKDGEKRDNVYENIRNKVIKKALWKR